MAAVYSTSFMQVPALFGSLTKVVPAGTLWVVRDVWAVWTGTSDLSGEIKVLGDTGQQFFQSLLTQLDANNLTFWQGRVVLENSLTVQTTSEFDVTVSGYQLTLP